MIRCVRVVCGLVSMRQPGPTGPALALRGSWAGTVGLDNRCMLAAGAFHMRNDKSISEEVSDLYLHLIHKAATKKCKLCGRNKESPRVSLNISTQEEKQ